MRYPVLFIKAAGEELSSFQAKDPLDLLQCGESPITLRFTVVCFEVLKTGKGSNLHFYAFTFTANLSATTPMESS